VSRQLETFQILGLRFEDCQFSTDNTANLIYALQVHELLRGMAQEGSLSCNRAWFVRSIFGYEWLFRRGVRVVGCRRTLEENVLLQKDLKQE
jgi:hypothetical protein